MERIASFCVDHTKLNPGIYLSRQDGDIITYDIRMKKPNNGDYIDVAAAHAIEHLFATFARNSEISDS
ncbi:MAG: S-ribosylhomocysteine lyase, partial [Oscillospiraceae bacterium]